MALRVLVVDPDRRTYDRVRIELADNGDPPFEVEWAPLCAEGPDAAGHRAPDAYLMALDPQAGDGAGLGLAQWIRAGGSALPILVLMDPDDPTMAERALAAGANAVLEPADLTAARLRRALSGASPAAPSVGGLGREAR